jgi:hypothetical protein
MECPSKNCQVAQDGAILSVCVDKICMVWYTKGALSPFFEEVMMARNTAFKTFGEKFGVIMKGFGASERIRVNAHQHEFTESDAKAASAGDMYAYTHLENAMYEYWLEFEASTPMRIRLDGDTRPAQVGVRRELSFRKLNRYIRYPAHGRLNEQRSWKYQRKAVQQYKGAPKNSSQNLRLRHVILDLWLGAD